MGVSPSGYSAGSDRYFYYKVVLVEAAGNNYGVFHRGGNLKDVYRCGEDGEI